MDPRIGTEVASGEPVAAAEAATTLESAFRGHVGPVEGWPRFLGLEVVAP